MTFPANPKARVERIKALARAGGLPSEREFERLLMRDAGLSRSQVRTVLTSGYKALLSTRDAGGGLDELVASIQRVAGSSPTREANKMSGLVCISLGTSAFE